MTALLHLHSTESSINPLHTQ